MTAPEDDRAPSPASARAPLEDAPTAGLLQAPRPGQAPTIRPGLVLAERYMVMRFLAQGGMGEIYEVEDLQLRERVALKTIRAAYAEDPQALERFKREIQLARRVTHGNVCRIFEFGVHHGRDGPTIVFLTMELLAGETLLEKLRRDGRMGVAEALPIVTQMIAALDTAHRAGVVHRDFKSANVLLVPSPGGPPRAVVTDFGLARLAAIEKAEASADTEVSGTFDYMAPEQIAGQEPTPAVDLYALGVVMYEMVAGVRPFGGGPQDSTIGVRQRDQPAPSPRVHVHDLEPRWEGAILRCLAQDPARRFRDAREVARALSGEPSRRRRVLRALAVGAPIALALAAGTYRLLPLRPDAPRTVPQRRSVAVLPFKNLSQQPDAAWLSPALSEMLTTELAAGQLLRTISGEDVARMRVELAVPEADTLARDTLRRIQANLGTDLVALGSYLSSTSELRVDVRVQDAVAGETLAAVTQTGARDDVLNVVARAGSELRRRLGLAGLTATQAEQLRAALPANPEAARLYSAGLAELRRFDALAARELLARAVAADPRFPLAHAALAESLSRLGHDDEARREAQLAFEEGVELPREDRLLVEARYRLLNRERAKAVDIYRVLFGFFPDNLEHGLRLAEAMTTAGRPQQALETLAALRQLRGSAPVDPRIDIGEAEAFETLGDFQREFAAARQAATRGREAGARLLIARARVLEAYAAGRMGQADNARAAAQEARSLYQAIGDRAGLGWALNRSAAVLYQQGRLQESLRVWQEASDLFEALGYRGALASVLNNASEVLFIQGELLKARQNLERARGFSGDFREARRAIIVPLNLNNVDAEIGDFATGERGYAAALHACQELGEKSLEASVKRHWGDMLLNAGDLARARGYYEQALEIHRRLVNPRYVAYTLYGLGKLWREQGDPTAARAALDEALQIRRQLADRVGVAETRLAIAELELDSGAFTAAEASAREILPVLTEEQVRDGQAQAHTVVALASSGQGRGTAAAQAIEAAASLASRSERPNVRLQIQVALALLTERRPAETTRRLRAALADAMRRGYKGIALEARLALASQATPAQARTPLAELERDARSLGFGRIAQLAARGQSRDTR